MGKNTCSASSNCVLANMGDASSLVFCFVSLSSLLCWSVYLSSFVYFVSFSDCSVSYCLRCVQYVTLGHYSVC